MTPAARVSAAIEVLDLVLAGSPVEKALTNWGRQNRYAGSKDRAAVRDLVFEAYRCLRSCAAIGGTRNGRGLMIGLLRKKGVSLETIFSGERFAPAQLTKVETSAPVSTEEFPAAVRFDCPDWLWPIAQQDLGQDAERVFTTLQSRAPVFLRVNLLKTDTETAQAKLLEEGIETEIHPRQPTALRVRSNPRRVQGSSAFKEGLIELQDASSQAVADIAPVRNGSKVLDLCAGGGGKTLAMAGRTRARYYVHDIDPRRLAPIQERAARSGVDIECLKSSDLDSAGPFDGVLCDVPCSGSGTWRRSPEGKWKLSRESLEKLTRLQSEILDQAVELVRPGGWIVYATCSFLKTENEAQVAALLNRHPKVRRGEALGLLPGPDGDGFFAQVFHLSAE